MTRSDDVRVPLNRSTVRTVILPYYVLEYVVQYCSIMMLCRSMYDVSKRGKVKSIIDFLSTVLRIIKNKYIYHEPTEDTEYASATRRVPRARAHHVCDVWGSLIKSIDPHLLEYEYCIG
jgi:hypothetical protein